MSEKVINCKVMLVSSFDEQKQSVEQQQRSNSLCALKFSGFYNEYSPNHSEIETTPSDTSELSSSVSFSNNTSLILHENNLNAQTNNRPKYCQLFGVQLEVNFLLLEAERRKLKVLKDELHNSLEIAASFIERKKHSQDQCHELLLTISRIQSQHNLLEKELAAHTKYILKSTGHVRIIEKVSFLTALAKVYVFLL